MQLKKLHDMIGSQNVQLRIKRKKESCPIEVDQQMMQILETIGKGLKITIIHMVKKKERKGKESN